MYKIRLSKNMASQVEGNDLTFPTRDMAWEAGITKYGSGSYDMKWGWHIEEEGMSLGVPLLLL